MPGPMLPAFCGWVHLILKTIYMLYLTHICERHMYYTHMYKYAHITLFSLYKWSNWDTEKVKSLVQDYTQLSWDFQGQTGWVESPGLFLRILQPPANSLPLPRTVGERIHPLMPTFWINKGVLLAFLPIPSPSAAPTSVEASGLWETHTSWTR